MTVDELVGLLTKLPLDLRVVANGNECGSGDRSPEKVSVVIVPMNTVQNCLKGRHRNPSGLIADADLVQALVLQRVSH